MRPLLATIDLAAIHHNYAAGQRCAPGRQALAVVKANAYGHGVREVVAPCLSWPMVLPWPASRRPNEVRLHGEQARMLLLEGCFAAAEYQQAAQLGLDVTCAAQRRAGRGTAGRAELAAPLRVWLKLDSGMHRLGFECGRGARLASAPAGGRRR